MEPRPFQHYHKVRRRGELACEDVLYRGTTPEVHLRHVVQVEVQHGGDVGMSVFELVEKTSDGRVRADIAAGVHQRLVDHRATDTLTPPRRELAFAG